MNPDRIAPASCWCKAEFRRKFRIGNVDKLNTTSGIDDISNIVLNKNIHTCVRQVEFAFFYSIRGIRNINYQ